MRCCEFYSPSAYDMERHDGLRIADDYMFDKPLKTPACTNPQVIGNQMFGGCPYARNQDKCNFYTPEGLKTIKASRVSRAGQDDVEMRIETTRTTFGIAQFYVCTVQGDEREIHHTIDAHEHGGKAQVMALELFQYELEQLGAEKTVHALDTQVDNSEFSYLLEVTDAVRTSA